MNHGPNLGSEREVASTQQEESWALPPPLPSEVLFEFCPVEPRNVMKCNGLSPVPGTCKCPDLQPVRLLASLHLLVIGACMLIARHIA